MVRIFFTLAVLSLLLLATAMMVGLSIGDLYHEPSTVTLQWATVHRLTGVAAALAVVLVESIVVTYFIGTSRWCKEVVDTYSLDPHPVRQSNQLKRRAFAVALGGMLAVIVVIALGASADPATGRPNTARWTDFHLVGALAGVAFIGWTYFTAWQYIAANQAIIQQILGEVGRIRRERGLEPLTIAAD